MSKIDMECRVISSSTPWPAKYSFTYCGRTIETTVTRSAAVVNDWVRKIRSQHPGKQFVGVDLKFRSHPIPSMSNKAATLQLCIGSRCLLLQLLYLENIPLSLRDFLGDSNITFLGFQVREKTEKLYKEHGLSCNKKVDIRRLAQVNFPISYCGRPSMKALALRIAGLPMRRRKCGDQCDWEARNLEEELIEYASVDAYASYAIAHALIN